MIMIVLILLLCNFEISNFSAACLFIYPIIRRLISSEFYKGAVINVTSNGKLAWRFGIYHMV